MLKDRNVRQAFEIEDSIRRENFTFVYERERIVACFDTSRNTDSQTDNMKLHFHENFPFKCKDAYDYFVFLYKKALIPQEGCAFIGWVNPDTYEPIVEEPIPKTFDEAMRGVPDKDPSPRDSYTDDPEASL